MFLVGLASELEATMKYGFGEAYGSLQQGERELAVD